MENGIVMSGKNIDIKRVFFIALCLMVLLVSHLFSARYYSEGQIIDSSADGEFDIEVYSSPGWVTDTIKEGGVWTGNEDLDQLAKNLRISGQIVHPEGSGLELTGKEIRRMAIRVFEQDLFKGTFDVDQKYNGKNVLPFLHVSVAVLPSGLAYAIHCSVRLIEEIDPVRATWTKDFPWQGITWEREKLLFSRRGQVPQDISKAITAMTKDFMKQYLEDIATRREIDAEYAEIEDEVEAEYLVIKQELEHRAEELEDVYQDEYKRFKDRVIEEETSLKK